MSAAAMRALFLDIGGVLGTNGWDRAMRRQAADTFGLDPDDLEERHHLTFGAYEEGRLNLAEYLGRAVFHVPRRFTLEDFQAFMLAQSRPYPEMIALVRRLKAAHGCKVATLSNEGRELTLYRIERFGLAGFVDYFICSCFVQRRKPDPEIYQMALDIGHVQPNEAAYVDDRLLFVEVARRLGIHGIHHTSFDGTQTALARVGLAVPEETVARPLAAPAGQRA